MLRDSAGSRGGAPGRRFRWHNSRPFRVVPQYDAKIWDFWCKSTQLDELRRSRVVRTHGESISPSYGHFKLVSFFVISPGYTPRRGWWR